MKKAGFISIVGVPNAGKSTFLNSVLKEKVSIVTSKPQTTRKRIKGILTEGNYQLVFIDTPGFHNIEKKVNKIMNEEVIEALKDADLLLFITDISKTMDENELQLAEKIAKLKLKKILLFNKIDLGINHEKEETLKNIVLPIKYFYIKAIEQNTIKPVIEFLKSELPEVPMFYYDENIISDITDRELVEEIIREKIFEFLYQEIPYSIYVEVIQFLEKDNKIDIDVNIVCEKESQKGIIIGKKGKMLERIRKASERELSIIFDKNVFLHLFVKVNKNWTKKYPGLIL